MRRGVREAHQGQAAWAASGVLGMLKDLGYVLQVDVLGDVVGAEVGENVALGDAQPGLRLTTENTLKHSIAPVVYDAVVEQAERVIIKFTLELPDGPLRYSPRSAIRVGPTPSFSPSRMANRSSLDSGSRLEVRGPISRSFSNSSAIGGLFLFGGIPLRGVLNVTLCLSHVAQLSLNRYLPDTIH